MGGGIEGQARSNKKVQGGAHSHAAHVDVLEQQRPLLREDFFSFGAHCDWLEQSHSPCGDSEILFQDSGSEFVGWSVFNFAGGGASPPQAPQRLRPRTGLGDGDGRRARVAEKVFRQPIYQRPLSHKSRVGTGWGRW